MFLQITDKVMQKDYDCTTFNCALTIPVSIKLREHILYAHISKETTISESVVSSLKAKLQNIKDTWKLFVTPQLEQIIKKRTDLSTPSPFLIEIFLVYDNDEAIFEKL